MHAMVEYRGKERQGPPFAAFAQSFQGRKKRKNGGNNTPTAAAAAELQLLKLLQTRSARACATAHCGLKELKLARGPGAYSKTRVGLFLH